MKEQWLFELEDGTHTIKAEFPINTFFVKFIVSFDGIEIYNTQKWVVGGDYEFRKYGHLFKIEHSGYGHLGKLTLYIDGEKVDAGDNQAPSEKTKLEDIFTHPASNKKISKSTANCIFISYRRDDSADVTGRIYDRLVQKFGKAVIFKDVDSIPLGVDFREYLDEMVGKCQIFLAVIGDQWVISSDSSGKRRLDDSRDFVRIEIESALKRKIPVIPLLVRGASMPVDDSLPTTIKELAYRNGIPIRRDPDFHNDMDRLIEGLESYLNE